MPKCDCGGTVKPDVVLYEEGLDQATIEKSVMAIHRADLLIVGGTSLTVYPAAAVPEITLQCGGDRGRGGLVLQRVHQVGEGEYVRGGAFVVQQHPGVGHLRQAADEVSQARGGSGQIIGAIRAALQAAEGQLLRRRVRHARHAGGQRLVQRDIPLGLKLFQKRRIVHRDIS